MPTNTPENHYLYTMAEYAKPPLLDIVKKITSDPEIKIIYDIGANSGATSILFSQSPYVESVYCFEPDDENFTYLKSTLVDPKYNLFNCGIYYGERTLPAFLPVLEDQQIYRTCGGYSVDPSRIHSGNQYRECDKIFQLKTLEELHVPPPDFIKLDCEGSEHNILRSSHLAKSAKYLFVETHHFQNFETFKSNHLPSFKTIVDIGSDQLLQRIDSE